MFYCFQPTDSILLSETKINYQSEPEDRRRGMRRGVGSEAAASSVFFFGKVKLPYKTWRAMTNEPKILKKDALQ